MGLYDIVHPPMPMMQVSVYGTQGTMIGDFTDNKGGAGQARVGQNGSERTLGNDMSA